MPDLESISPHCLSFYTVSDDVATFRVFEKGLDVDEYAMTIEDHLLQLGLPSLEPVLFETDHAEPTDAD